MCGGGGPTCLGFEQFVNSGRQLPIGYLLSHACLSVHIAMENIGRMKLKQEAVPFNI